MSITGKCLNKLWHSPIMKYYAVAKNDTKLYVMA